MRAALSLIRVSLILAALLAAPSLRAADEEPQRAILTLIVNHGKQAEVTVVLRGTEIWVARDDLVKAGLVSPTGRSESFGGRAHLLVSSISSHLTVALDERDLSLRIDAPASALAPSVINLRPGAPPDLVHRGDTSAFINYAARVTDVEHLDLTGEAGVSVAGNLLATTVTATPRGAVRGLSSLTLDHPADMVRVTVGDATVSGGPLGGGLVNGGLTIAKTFALDPYFVSHPSFGYATSALTPSTLEVYVNGVLVRSQPIPPGMVRLDNVPVPSGGGEVRYVVRDAFGREQSTATPYFLSASLLGQGVHEYTYALGAQRQSLGTRSFEYGRVGFLGTHRYGVSSALTVGGRLEASIDLVSGGANASMILPIGQLDLGAAASAAAGKLGGAGYAAYLYSTPRFVGRASVRVASDDYATLGLAPRDRRDSVEVDVSTSVHVRRNMSLAAHYALAVDRDEGASFRLGVSANVQLMPRMSLIVSAGRATHPDGSAPIDLFATLSCALGRATTGSISARFHDGEAGSVVDLSSPLPRGEGTGYRATASLSKQPEAQGTALLQTSFGRYQATGAFSADGPHLALEAAGALVAVSGAGLFASRPVQDGFAVIRVPGAKGIRGYADNHVIGRTDDEGNLLVPDLLPFYGNRLRIDDADLPIEYSVGATEQVIAPPFRGGALVTFEARRTRFLRGQLVVDAGGHRVIPSYGDLRVSAGGTETTSPIADAGDFELADLAPGTYPATIDFAGTSCSFSLAVPDWSSPIVELGQLVCARAALPKKAAPRRR